MQVGSPHIGCCSDKSILFFVNRQNRWRKTKIGEVLKLLLCVCVFLKHGFNIMFVNMKLMLRWYSSGCSEGEGLFVGNNNNKRGYLGVGDH